MGSNAAKTRGPRAADAASAEPQRHLPHLSSGPLLPSKSVVMQKSVRGVITAFIASAKPLGVAGACMSLVWIALKLVDRFQLWMTAAGVLLLVLSIASAVQEVVTKPLPVVATKNNYDVEDCKMITIPTVEKEIAFNMTPSTPSPATETAPTVSFNTTTVVPSPPTQEMQNNKDRCDSSTLELGDKPLTVTHCGTVIDIQGSRGYIIPHSASNRGFDRVQEFKLPLVIAFELTSVLAMLQTQILVGQTVEFAFSGDETSSETVLAVNVTPVSADAEIAKTRTALLSCKQAREESFARAMGELKMISPRNVPIKHHVDLIKYAECLDDDGEIVLDEAFI